MKPLLYLSAVLLIVSCDSKKAKLDELYAKQTAIKKQIDSVVHLKNVLMEKEDPLATSLDTNLLNQSVHYSALITILEHQLKRVNSSIDSLSKY